MSAGEPNGLPEGWSQALLGEIADCRLGKMLDQAKNRGEPRPYLRNVNVQWGQIRLDDVKEMRIEAKEQEQYAVRPGDLLVCEGGEPGRCAVWNDNREMYLQKALHRVRPRGGLSAEYLRWWIQDAASTGRLADLLTGSTIRHLPSRRLARLGVALPPVAEQRRIAQRLDEIADRRDATRSHLDAARRITQRLRTAVLASAASGRLTENWREAHGRPEWPTATAHDVCAKVQSGTTPKSWHAGPGGVPFLKVYNVVDQRLNFGYRPQFVSPSLHVGAMRRATALPGDVVMNIVGPPLGKVAIINDEYPEWSINQALTLFRPSDKVTTDWLYIFLCSGISVAKITGKTRGSVGQVNISLTQCRAFRIPVPPIDEQAELARRTRALLAAADSLAVKVGAVEAAVDRSSRGAMGKAWRGELVPTEAALADEEGREFESGQALLARVATASRTANGGSGKASAGASFA